MVVCPVYLLLGTESVRSRGECYCIVSFDRLPCCSLQTITEPASVTVAVPDRGASVGRKQSDREREKTRTPRVAEKLSHPGPPDAKCILIHCGTQRRPNTRGHDGVEERVRHPFIDIAVMPPRWSGGGKGVGESVDMAKIPTRMVSATTRLLAYTLERDRREG